MYITVLLIKIIFNYDLITYSWYSIIGKHLIQED